MCRYDLVAISNQLLTSLDLIPGKYSVSVPKWLRYYQHLYQCSKLGRVDRDVNPKQLRNVKSGKNKFVRVRKT